MPQQQVHILHGVPASAGIAIGQAVVIDTKKIERYPKLRVSEDRVEDELGRFEHAVQLSQKQITEAIHTLEAHQVIREHILILETHLLMLKDPALVDRVKQLITEDYINAEWALKIALREIEEAIEAIDDEYIRSRVTDTSFVGERLLRNLVG